MYIYVNEIKEEINNGDKVSYVVERLKPLADIYIVNGYPVDKDFVLKDKDRLVLIQKGVMPEKDELEAVMQGRHTPEVYYKLKSKKVLLIGLGGLGSAIAIALARIGVGKIIGVDFDIVEPSNLNRQQYFIKHIGMKKVHAMKEIISDITPFCDFEGIDAFVLKENISSFIKDVDIVIEAVDREEIKSMIVQETLIQNKDLKIIASSGMAGYFDSNLIITRKINNRFYLCGDGKEAAREGCGLMAPRVGIAASHQANLAVRILLNEE